MGELECRIENRGEYYHIDVVGHSSQDGKIAYTTLNVVVTLHYNIAGQLYWSDRRKMAYPDFWEWLAKRLANEIYVNS
jgi:hypothetical protein